MKSQLILGDMFRADIRTSRDADGLNGQLQSALGFDYRYQVARLAIGLSLGDLAQPELANDLLGKPIRGETLFGQEEADLALWTALIIEHGPDEPPTKKLVVELAAAHWQRGVRKLQKLWSKFDGGPPEFLCALGDVAARA